MKDCTSVFIASSVKDCRISLSCLRYAGYDPRGAMFGVQTFVCTPNMGYRAAISRGLLATGQKATERNVKMLLSCQDVPEPLRVVLKTVEQIVLYVSSVLVCSLWQVVPDHLKRFLELGVFSPLLNLIS